jgi:2-phosphosulfolactate phosphatase
VLEWGEHGAQSLQAIADVLIVVDVLSFSTCVDIACGRGARIIPFPTQDRKAAELEATRRGAELAGRRSDLSAKFTLSASTLMQIASGTRLLLPSPNGSRISFAAKASNKAVMAGCLRNALSVANVAARIAGRDGTIAVIPAGERWSDGSLRPAIEDLLGAGAIIAALECEMSVEASIARFAFQHAQPDLRDILIHCVSGQELIDKGFPSDVEFAAALNVSRCAPLLAEDGSFTDEMSR